MAKWLGQRSHSLEVPSLNPPGAKAFFSSSSINSRVSLIRSLVRYIFADFLFPIITLAVLPEAKQAQIYTECGVKIKVKLKHLVEHITWAKKSMNF